MWPAIIATVAGLVGGRLNRNAQSDINADNIRAQQQTNWENIQAAERFAKNSIAWRVEDAKKSGIHPLYALGSQPFMPPTSVAGHKEFTPDYSMAEAGQNISRAMEAMRDRKERERAAATLAAASIQQQQLDNELTRARIDALRSETARLNAAQVGPPSPSTTTSTFESMGGGRADPRVQPQSANPVISSGGNPAREAGNITDYAFVRTRTGGLAVVPSRDMKERMEDDVIQQSMWAVRNQVLPFASGVPRPNTRDFPLPEGYEWAWYPYAQEFRATPNMVARRRYR